MTTATATSKGSKHPNAARVVALSGAASTVAVVVASGITDTAVKGGVNPTLGPDGILLATRDLVTDLQIGGSVFCLAAVLLLAFLSQLWRRLRLASEPAALVAVAGGVLLAGLMVGAARDAIALATAVDLGDGITAQVLTTTGWDTARVAAVPLLAMVAAAVMAGIGSDVLPRWFRWFSAVMIVPLVVALAPVGPAGMLGLVGMVWVLVASLMLAADPGRTARTSRSTTSM